MSKSHEHPRSSDSIRYGKDCPDFECLPDGTIVRECKYCRWSQQCRQVDIIVGIELPMESHYLKIMDPITKEVVEHDYFCTGMHDVRPYNERLEDDKVS